VRDYGAGVDPGAAPQIFDLFFQASQGIQRAKGGLGIGLTLVRRIAELHEGRVSVASQGIGQGALFKVELPAIDAPEAAPAMYGRSAKRSQCNVLVIEDAEDARESLRKILESEGHHVHAAKDGASGLKALLELHPHIALVDIGLPEFDGYEIARRARSAGVRTRLVAISGYGLPQDKARAADAGFDAHLTKPADPHRVLALVSEAACA
jgi:CheY-like chemotaxis protein